MTSTIMVVAVVVALVTATSAAPVVKRVVVPTPDRLNTLKKHFDVNIIMGEEGQKVIVGEDDRRDMWQVEGNDPNHPPPPNAAQLAYRGKESVAAMVSSGSVDPYMSNGRFTGFNSYTNHGSSYSLCSNQRFFEQPTLASCSGTLVSANGIITAGHCINSGNCAARRFVFNYYVDSEDSNGVPSMHEITTDDVYSCSSVTSVLENGNNGNLDWAYVTLDRDVVGHSPVPFQPNAEALPADTPIVVIGFGAGLPMKIDAGGEVENNRASTLDYFTGSLDTFGGNSGSGVFTADGSLMVGILVRGATDYVNDGGCNVVNELAAGTGSESCTYVHHASSVVSPVSPDPVNECATNNGGCSHTCTDTQYTFTCSCPSDMIMTGNGLTCVLPTNECLTNNGGCEDVCSDSNLALADTVECSCSGDDSALAPDGTSCVTCQTQTITFNTASDWSEEMSWDVTTDAGAATSCSSQSTGSYSDNQQYTQTCCLAYGDYVLTCRDSYGDGWHWSGSTATVEISGTSYCGNTNGWASHPNPFTWGTQDTPSPPPPTATSTPTATPATPTNTPPTPLPTPTEVDATSTPAPTLMNPTYTYRATNMRNGRYQALDCGAVTRMTLSDATAQCDNSADCNGVFDYRCDDPVDGWYRLCNTAIDVTSEPSGPSCMYTRTLDASPTPTPDGPTYYAAVSLGDNRWADADLNCGDNGQWTYDDAAAACDATSGCTGFYDWKCDNDPTSNGYYRLCSPTSQWDRAAEPTGQSCMHTLTAIEVTYTYRPVAMSDSRHVGLACGDSIQMSYADAETSCSDNADCIGFFDWRCNDGPGDSSGWYRICEASSFDADSETPGSSCLYAKEVASSPTPGPTPDPDATYSFPAVALRNNRWRSLSCSGNQLSTLDDAIAECEGSADCTGVYDWRCDNPTAGYYRICDGQIDVDTEPAGPSCMYTKTVDMPSPSSEPMPSPSPSYDGATPLPSECAVSGYTAPGCDRYRVDCPFSSDATTALSACGDEPSPCSYDACGTDSADRSACVGCIRDYCTSQITTSYAAVSMRTARANSLSCGNVALMSYAEAEALCDATDGCTGFFDWQCNDGPGDQAGYYRICTASFSADAEPAGNSCMYERSETGWSDAGCTGFTRP